MSFILFIHVCHGIVFFITHERPVVSKLLNDHHYSIFIFSNEAQDRWHFINVNYLEKLEMLMKHIYCCP